MFIIYLFILLCDIFTTYMIMKYLVFLFKKIKKLVYFIKIINLKINHENIHDYVFNMKLFNFFKQHVVQGETI